VILNHAKKFFFYPLETVDLEEKKLIFRDLLNSKREHTSLAVLDPKISLQTSFFGGSNEQECYGYKTKRYRAPYAATKLSSS
jgi:hypothetical protein